MNHFLFNTDKKSLGSSPHAFWVESGYAYVTPSNDTQYRQTLESIRTGDYIFAYENQVGIVAIGQATAEWDGIVHYDVPEVSPDPNGEIYKVKVRWLPELRTVSVAEIKSVGVSIIPSALYTIRDKEAADAVVEIAKAPLANDISSELNDSWTEEELRESVAAYLDMQHRQRLGEKYVKAQYYTKLAERFGRSKKAFEYRMQNISYIFSVMGREWLEGLKPAKNIGANVATTIEKIIADLEGQQFEPLSGFETQVKLELDKNNVGMPAGSTAPTKSSVTVTQFARDPKVKAWVLKAANHRCECCQVEAPFTTSDGMPYLEIHHLRRLADKGTDTITNAVALCPNCHRELHFGLKKATLINELYSRIDRLVRE